MRPISSQTFLLFSRSSAHRRFHSPRPSPSPSARRQYEEESRGVRVSVWWDFENCSVPQGCNVFRVAHSVTSAVRGSGIKGPVQITAFGDVSQLSRANQEAMSATGISLTHIPNGGKNSADRSLLIDLMCWVSHNPPPAHLFLISGDRDFATVLHRLRMSNYNILLAGPESSPGVLCSAASIVWQWNALAKGENVTGKYFNQPPDGPYNSWYGHYKVPIENPFAVIEQPSCPKLVEIPESNQDPKPRPVPRTVIRQIRHILCAHPKGISITDLRSELGKCTIDKDLYGFRKFSRFLLSMPHILKLQSGPDGQLFVHSATPEWPEFNKPNQGLTSGPVAINEETESLPNPMVSTKGVNGKPLLPRTTEQNVKPYENIGKPVSTNTIEVNFKKPEEKIEKSSSPRGVEVIVKNNEKVEKVVKNNEKFEKIVKNNENIEKLEQAETSNSSLVENCDSTPGVGLFGRTWRQWCYGMDDVTGIENSSGESCIKNVKVDKVDSSSTSHIKIDEYSDGKITEENSVVKVADSDKAKATGDVGIFKRMAKWCMFWRGRPIDEDSNKQSGEDFESVRDDSGEHELFSRKSFWKELEAFLNTPPNGSVLVLHSMSREQLAHNLQKHGPSILRPLSQSDLLHLVDVLITDKRWVEESLSQAYPFKLVLPPKHSSSPNKSALRSAFMDSSSSPISEKNPKNQNFAHNSVSTPITDKKTRGFDKSRNDILSDITKLVDKIVKENPEGFNMGSVRKRFLDEYGYPLDIQKLGYQKLTTLLQIMPGTKVESSFIYPICNGTSGLEFASFVEENNNNRASSKSCGESSNLSNKDDELDATWDELGPVADTVSNQKEFGSQKSAKRSNAKRLNPEYEALKDDVISDSEEENLEIPEKPKVNQEDSSLLRILDSWYGSKEEKDTKEISESEDDVAKNCENESKGSYGCGGLVMKSEASSSRYGVNTYSARKISFVSERSGHNREKMIDGIMDSLQKSSELRVH